MTLPDLSVVIPAFNERERLAASLAHVAAYLDRHAPDAEVLVVDDGSTDGTGDLARRLLAGRRGAVLAHAANQGKGAALRTGVRAARGRYILMTDADLSCSIDQHGALHRALIDGALDLAIGARSLAASVIAERQHPGREWMGKAFNVLVRAVTGLPYRDTQCGFKLLRAATVRPVVERLTLDRFAFDVELIVRCHDAGLRVGEVPVVWRNSPASRVRLVTDSALMVRDLVRLRLGSANRR